ncbi:unnamed protein product, partial [Ixodes hexagonus]
RVNPCLSTVIASMAYASLYLLVPYIVRTIVYPTCTRPDCYNFPKELSMAMDVAADPCTDFYQFVCGRWSKVHPVDTNQFTSLQRKIFFSLYDDIRKGPWSQRSAREKSAIALGMCEGIFINREEHLDDLRNVLIRHNLGWPDVPDADLDVLDVLVGLALDADIHLLFQMKLVPNFKQDDRLILSMSQSPGLVAWFQSRILHLPGPSLGTTLLQIANGLGSGGNYNAAVESLLKMDTDLMSMYFEGRDKDVIGYSQYQELGDLTAGRISSERWLEAINRHLPQEAQMTAQNELYIIGTAYLAVTSRFLDKYASETRRMRFFLGWHVVRTLLPLASYGMAKTLMAESTESQMAVTYLESCIGRVSDIAPYALAHFFFGKFLTESVLRSAESLVNGIREASLMSFRNLSWMEEGTRREALHKLASLHKIVAFPKGLSSKEAIDNHYSYLPEFR